MKPEDNNLINARAIQDILKHATTSIAVLNTHRTYQEDIKRHNEMMNRARSSISCIGLSASDRILQDEIKRINEMMKSTQTFAVNPVIHSFTRLASHAPKIDEETTIKKSQWSSLQEELATKEQRITQLEKRVSELEKTTIPELDRKVDEAMDEFHTDMEKNMPDVHHVSKYLRSMESNLGDPDDEYEES